MSGWANQVKKLEKELGYKGCRNCRHQSQNRIRKEKKNEERRTDKYVYQQVQ